MPLGYSCNDPRIIHFGCIVITPILSGFRNLTERYRFAQFLTARGFDCDAAYLLYQCCAKVRWSSLRRAIADTRIFLLMVKFIDFLHLRS